MKQFSYEAGRACLIELHHLMMCVNLPFFLMQGTALGAYRDGGFTPSEKDIDLGVLFEDFDKVPIDHTLRTFLLAGFDIELVTMPFDRPRTLVLTKLYGNTLVKTDIVTWALSPDDKDRFACSPVRRHEVKPYAIVHKRETLESTIPLTLFDRTYKVPADIEGYLEAEYGADWKTPKDDHVSRTRVYNYVEKKGIPVEYLSHAKHQPAARHAR